MNKKGQITIFIIIAIIIIGTILIFFAARDMFNLGTYSPEVGEISVFVKDCIKSVGNEVVYEIGANGGYFFPPEFSTATGIPVYYSDGKSYMPSKNQIEKEISNYINEKMFFCTKNFVNFPELKIKQGEIETTTRIEENNVILNVKYPLSISKGDNTIAIKDFDNIKIPVRLGIVYDSINKMVQDQLKEDSICLNCILDISLKNDLYIDMIDYDKEIVIFSVIDDNSVMNNKTFRFIFANKYKGELEI